MKIAVVSDTHMPRGSRSLPATCVERLRAADLIVHAGDFVGLSFLEELRGLGPPVEAVYGNMDEPLVRDVLPEEHVVLAEGTRIGLVHIAGPRGGREARLLSRFRGCDAVVYGHTHVPEVERCGEVWILNPGSPTERRRSPARSMLELVVNGRELRPTLVDLGT